MAEIWKPITGYEGLYEEVKNASNKLTEMAREIMAREILAIEADLPYRFDYSDNSHPTLDDFELNTFEQTWGSTALGFGGIGEQAMTTARTYVFVPIGINQGINQKCFVYFAGRFAYAADYSEKFMEDVLKQNVAAVYESGKYKV